MEKTATLNLRVNPVVKERAEKVLSRLGIPMSTAIDIYLNQISLTGGIPFSVSLPKAHSRRKCTECGGSVHKIPGEPLI